MKVLNRLLYGFSLVSLICILYACDMRDNFMELCYEPYLIMVKIDVNDERQSDFSNYEESDISLLREVKDVVLYVFDINDKYLGYHITKLNKLTALPYNDFDSLKVVSISIDKDLDNWTDLFIVGNCYKSDDIFTKLSKTASMEENNHVISPNDFMFDRKHFGKNPNNNKNVVYYMFVTSKVGAMKVYTKGLQSWADLNYGKTDNINDIFSFIIGNTFDCYNFSGDLTGDWVSYNPQCHYCKYDSINTPMFNLYPTVAKNGVKISILRNGDTIFPGNKISKVLLFPIQSGWCTKVEMDFQSTGGVNIDIEGWGDVDINIDL